MIPTIAHLLLKGADFLKKDPSHNSTHSLTVPRKILSHYLDVDVSYLLIHGKESVSSSIASAYERDLALFKEGVPFSRLWNKREFWSLDFILSKDTLDPRPETEHLVEIALATLKAQHSHIPSPHFLDLGTGSGCILLSLLHETPTSRGIGVDISQEALCIARLNASALNLSERTNWIQGSWTDSLQGPFHLVVSNPPYLDSTEMASLPPIVSAFDPPLALWGGPKGTEAYEKIVAQTPLLLAPQGALIVEIGHTQGNEVASLFQKNGFHNIQIHKDLAKKDRIVFGTLP